jgi:hypothetical protein
MAESTKSNRLTLVKLRSTWVITSKTEPTTPNDLLDQVKTTCGQPLVKARSNPTESLMSVNALRNFCHVLQIHLNTSKSTNTKVVQFVEGHNFPVDWHFKF